MDSKSYLLKESNDIEQNKILSSVSIFIYYLKMILNVFFCFKNIFQAKLTVENDKENSSRETEDNTQHLKHQLATSKITVNQLKEKLESNNMARLKLDEHVQCLNQQIDELLKKIKLSNIKHLESVEHLATLQNTISALKKVNFHSYVLYYFVLLIAYILGK